MVANDVPELDVDANYLQRLERLERNVFGRALHDPVEEKDEAEPTENVQPTHVVDAQTNPDTVKTVDPVVGNREGYVGATPETSAPANTGENNAAPTTTTVGE